MIDLYVGAKLGPMNIASFNISTGDWKRFRVRRPDGVARALYMLRPTGSVRVLQGGVAVLGTDTTAPVLLAFGYYPMVVENFEDEYISIRSNSASTGNLEISIISDVQSWTLVDA